MLYSWRPKGWGCLAPVGLYFSHLPKSARFAMERPQPYCTRYLPFKTEDAARLLRETEDNDPLIITTPPVKPKGGGVVIYFSKGNDSFKGKSHTREFISATGT